WMQLDKDKAPLVRAFTADTGKPFSPGRTDQSNYPVQSFVAAENGTFRFVLQLTTKDGAVTESEPVTVIVGTGTPPDPPAANGLVSILTGSKTAVPAGKEVTLDGSKSHSDNNANFT